MGLPLLEGSLEEGAEGTLGLELCLSAELWDGQVLAPTQLAQSWQNVLRITVSPLTRCQELRRITPPL